MRKGTEKIERRERKEKEKRKENGRKGGPASTGLQCSNSERFNGSGSELVCAPRGRGSLLHGYSLSKGHSMAKRYSPNGGAGLRIVLIKLLMI